VDARRAPWAAPPRLHVSARPRQGASRGRVPAADLDERDPDYIRETLPRLWLLASL
jgi:hypothetical protein